MTDNKAERRYLAMAAASRMQRGVPYRELPERMRRALCEAEAFMGPRPPPSNVVDLDAHRRRK